VVAKDELDALDSQVEQTTDDLNAVNTEIATLQAQADMRRANPDRLMRDAFRLIDMPQSAIPANLDPAELDALADLRQLTAELNERSAVLAARSTDLARLRESVAAKQAELARARARAQVLVAAAARDDSSKRAAEVAVLQQIASEVAGAQTSLAQLIAVSLPQAQGTGSPVWQLPARGPLSQAFGPSTLALEPGMLYQGTFYPHFHAAIDIAVSFGTPVAAAADGVVTFVGHLSDGAEIVLIAHPGGYVSEYAHLDDTFAPPPVRAGQNVKAGQVIGFVGLTGITTGPHLHFAVLRNGTPVDPILVISRS
jgi:murein DD-endopeptidase MepM/ murein hydrolase activator NlpD